MASAAILAGGRATRFGGLDKSALVVDGRSIFERQIAELSQVADEILIIGRSAPAPKTTRRHSSVPPSRKGETTLSFEAADGSRPAVTIRFANDQLPGRGPLGGLDAALSSAAGDPVLVVACDMPFITADLLRYLLSCSDGVDAVVPKSDRGYHPLCAVYKRACRPAIRRRLAAGRLAVSGLFDDVRVRLVGAPEIEPFGDPGRLLANVNTPAEHEALRASDHEV